MHKIFKKIGVLMLTLALLLGIFIISGCGQEDPSQELDTLRFGLLPDITCLPMVVAEKEGIYEELGLQVELVYFSKAMERDQALQAGKIDGAISDFVAVGFFQDSGFDVKITSQNEGTFTVLASPYSTINSVADLEGKTVGVSQNTIIEFMIDEILMDHGLTPEDVNKEFISAIPLRREMLLQGQIDAACLPEPLGALSVEQGASKVTDSEEEDLTPSVIIFTQEAIEDKRESVELFYHAYGETAELINPDPSQYNDLLLEKLRFPEEIIDTYEIPYFAQPFIPDEEDAEKYLNWLEGRVDRDLTFEDLVDDSFAE